VHKSAGSEFTSNAIDGEPPQLGGKSAVDVSLSKIEPLNQDIKNIAADQKVNEQLLWFRKNARRYILRGNRCSAPTLPAVA
jgi:hypothetical protein